MSHPRVSPRPRKAFTLIELIVVIVILGILAMIAIPTFGKVVKTSQDKATEMSLASYSREVAALAALDGGPVTTAHLTAAAEDYTLQSSAAGTYAAKGKRIQLLLDDRLAAVAEKDGVKVVGPALQQGEVSYKVNTDKSIGLATTSPTSNCVMASISPTYQVSSWIVAKDLQGNCTGGVALAGQTDSSDVVALPTGNYFRPSTLTGLTAVPSLGQVTFTWAADTTPGTTYEIVRDGKVVASNLTAPTWIDTNSGSETSHSYQVVAVRNGNKSEAASIAASGYAQSGAATGVVVVPSPGKAAITWAAPASTGGAPVTSYQVKVLSDTNGAATGVTGETTRTVAGNVTSIEFTGLTNATGYRFQVTPVTAAGPGAVSATTATVNPGLWADTLKGSGALGNVLTGTGSWQVLSGTWTRSTFQVGTSSGAAVAVVDGTTPDVTASVDVASTALGGNDEVVVRALPDGSHIRARQERTYRTESYSYTSPYTYTSYRIFESANYWTRGRGSDSSVSGYCGGTYYLSSQVYSEPRTENGLTVAGYRTIGRMCLDSQQTGYTTNTGTNYYYGTNVVLESVAANGTITQLGRATVQGDSASTANISNLKVETTGTSIKVYTNLSATPAITATSTFNQGATLHGIGRANSATSQSDSGLKNFRLVAN